MGHAWSALTVQLYFEPRRFVWRKQSVEVSFVVVSFLSLKMTNSVRIRGWLGDVSRLAGVQINRPPNLVSCQRLRSWNPPRQKFPVTSSWLLSHTGRVSLAPT